MTAKEAMSAIKKADKPLPGRQVEADMPLIEVLPLLLDSPQREIGVSEDGVTMGVIDRNSLLEGLGKMIVSRDDCSVITVECKPEQYSASLLARAVEDSDANLVDLLTSPGDEGSMLVTLRVGHRDPSATVRSLERYDFRVIEAHGAGSSMADADLAAERLLALQALLSV